MLMPRRVKHRKVMRGRMSGVAKGGSAIAFGDYALMTEEPAWITSRQIEAARRAMTRYVKRGGKIWIRIFPDKPATKMRDMSALCSRASCRVMSAMMDGSPRPRCWSAS